jgi:hypothetical protein
LCGGEGTTKARFFFGHPTNLLAEKRGDATEEGKEGTRRQEVTKNTRWRMEKEEKKRELKEFSSLRK